MRKDHHIGSVETTMWLICVGYLVGFIGATGLGLSYPGRVAVVTGLGVPITRFVYGLYRYSALRRKAVELHRTAHDLTEQAKRLEIEDAKASGAFERWEKR